jgi:hypothetical protein
MKSKQSTFFWLVFTLWVFVTLFMSFVELVTIYGVYTKREIAYLIYTLLTSSISGLLLVLFVSLYLFKNKLILKRLSIMFLVVYLTTQIAMIGFCFYLDFMKIKNLFSAAIFRIVFVLFQVFISFLALRNKKNDSSRMDNPQEVENIM